jgi:hypothetical protein
MKHIFPYAAVAIFVAAGCGGPAYEYDSIVTGTVTIDGELAKSGTVTFHPVKEGLPSIGRIFPDGSFSLRTGQGDLKKTDGGTVVSGDYVVTVSVTGPPVEGSRVAEGGPPVPGPSLVAKKYARKDTSDLRRTVKPGPNVFVLELDVAEPEPLEETPEAVGTDGNEDVETAEAAGASTPPATSGTSDNGATSTQPANAAEETAPPDAAAPKNTVAPPAETPVQ